jgi:hypothetical protein
MDRLGEAALHVDHELSSARGRRCRARGCAFRSTTRQALEAGIAAIGLGGRLGDSSHTIETVAGKAGYGLPDGPVILTLP